MNAWLKLCYRDYIAILIMYELVNLLQVILDLLSKLGVLSDGRVKIIFIDTFHLFPETYSFLEALEVWFCMFIIQYRKNSEITWHFLYLTKFLCSAFTSVSWAIIVKQSPFFNLLEALTRGFPVRTPNMLEFGEVCRNSVYFSVLSCVIFMLYPCSIEFF